MRTMQFQVLLAVVMAIALVVVFQPATVAQGPTPSSNPETKVVSSPLGTVARLTYQGRLTNASGTPINSPVGMVFRIYDDADTTLWTSSSRTVTPVNGLFTVYLGDGDDPSINSPLLTNAASIGVTVGNDAEMTPRQPLNTVVGHSVKSAGVIGSSDSSFGLYGVSNSGTVLRLRNGYSGTTTLNGTGGGSLVTGLNSPMSATLFEVTNVGDVKQLRDADGLVKAGVYGSCRSAGSSVVRSFNNVSGTISIENGYATGYCIIDFGFQVTDRFWSVMALGGFSTPRNADCWGGPTNSQLNCFNYDENGTGQNGPIMVLIY